jgi:hypothetical protein
MDFSRAECFDTTAIGKSTLSRRLQSLGIKAVPCVSPHYALYCTLLEVVPLFLQSAPAPRRTRIVAIKAHGTVDGEALREKFDHCVAGMRDGS